MSLNEKFGRGASNVRKVNITATPDVNMLQRLFSDLSTSLSGTQCDISWESAENFYTLSLVHSRNLARANWKLYRGKGLQASVIWDYATNDMVLVRKSVLEAISQVKTTQTRLKPIGLPQIQEIPEERRAVNINSNLSNKLKKLFIETQDDRIVGIPAVPLPKSATESPVRSAIQPQIDLTPGREILAHLFSGQFGIFSFPTFLFFLEREYYEAFEHKTPLALVLCEAVQVTPDGKSSALSASVLHEVTKVIKHIHRKTDILAEYDQNRFAVLLSDTNSIGGRVFVERVDKALRKNVLIQSQGNNSVKFTFGIASLGEHCKNLPVLLTFVEKALERAQQLKTNIYSDLDMIAEGTFKEELAGKSVDLVQTQKLLAELISGGIFTYPAFLAFLEHEYFRCARKSCELLVMILKVRIYEETYEDESNMLPQSAFFEVIRRVGSLLTKRDVFAHYGHGNFVIMRSNASYAQMQAFAKKAIQSITSEEWLTPECPGKSLRTRVEIYNARPHTINPNIFCLPAADES